MRGTVLLLQQGVGPFDYRLPPGTPPGTVVQAPLGRRMVAGVVFDDGLLVAPPLGEHRLRDATPLSLPPLPMPLRQLVAWVADYYVVHPSLVLRMVLPQAAFHQAPVVPRYALGATPVSRHPARQALLQRLQAVRAIGPATLARWAEAADSRVATLRTLVKQGVLVAAPASAGVPAPALDALPAGPQLTPAQQLAADALQQAVREGGFQPFLLDGVTGAGKTEVYLEAVAAALSAGRQALVLVPEIALTPGLLARFRQRFGFAPLAWHSGLGMAARRDAYRRIADGSAPVIVGARSALFLPMPSLGVIIVDEAHEAAYKQEDGVPYHGRDVAVMRGHFAAIPVVLATATPAIETMEQVTRGTYRLLHLPSRFGGATLPAIHLVDLTRTPPSRGHWIAPPLADAIAARLAAGEQSLLFLNRRGYAPLTLCRACGERIACPNCTAWLVEHRGRHQLMCHHCGLAIPTPSACPACHEADCLVASGPGVERLAEEVAARWPAARLRIVTSDTIVTEADMATLAAAVDGGEVDILIGTQMLAKGHDFPDLTLVGVIDADLGLDGGDLRAAERSFQQIRQVAGRAGRAARPGEVFLQTHQPGARIMQALASGDSARFFAAERAARLAAAMPPFGRLAALIISATDATAAAEVAMQLGRTAPERHDLHVFGPAPAPLAKLRGRFRHRLLVQASRQAPLQALIRDWLGRVKLPAGVRVAVDVDPQSFL